MATNGGVTGGAISHHLNNAFNILYSDGHVGTDASGFYFERLAKPYQDYAQNWDDNIK
jgi:prepilin-type processing-associated H-X9-DG protein